MSQVLWNILQLDQILTPPKPALELVTKGYVSWSKSSTRALAPLIGIAVEFAGATFIRRNSACRL